MRQRVPIRQRFAAPGLAGRRASVASARLSGVLLALHWDPQHLIMIAALPVFLAGVAAFMISVGARYEAHRAARAAKEATS